MESRQDKINDLHRRYLQLVLETLVGALGEDLISVVVFGSVARGEAGEGSDIDIIVVSKAFVGSVGGRLKVFENVDRRSRYSEERRMLREKGFGTLICPVPLNPEEVKQNPPILLDLLTDGVILYDKGKFMENHLLELKSKLKRLGARKIYLPSGSWYWDLKPDYKLGDVVEI